MKEEFLRSLRKNIGQWFIDLDGKFYPRRHDVPACEAEWGRLFRIAYERVQEENSNVKWPDPPHDAQ